MSQPPTVAVLGIGTMGAGMASSLLRDGLGVRVWNRTQARAQALAGDGAEVAGTAAEAVAGADVVITMLFDADAVIDVMSGAAAAFSPGAIWLQSATIGLAGMTRVAALAEAEALSVLDAPMLGTKEPAEQGKLVVLASGDPSLRARVEPVLEAIGSRTVWAGDLLGEATALKLACNAWVASITAATAQSLALASGLAVEPRLFLQAIAGGPSDTPYAQLKGTQMLDRNFTPSFGLDGVRKDLSLITDAAGRAGVDTTVLQALSEVYRRASDQGHGKDDISAVVSTFEAGLVGRNRDQADS